VWAASLVALVIAPITLVTVINPAVSWACDVRARLGFGSERVHGSGNAAAAAWAWAWAWMMCIGKPTIYDEDFCTPIGG
jgi:hypothetical protein